MTTTSDLLKCYKVNVDLGFADEPSYKRSLANAYFPSELGRQPGCLLAAGLSVSRHSSVDEIEFRNFSEVIAEVALRFLCFCCGLTPSFPWQQVHSHYDKPWIGFLDRHTSFIKRFYNSTRIYWVTFLSKVRGIQVQLITVKSFAPTCWKLSLTD